MLYSVLLAGGLSTRMGEDKASLHIQGESLLDRALNLLSHTGSDRVLISGVREGYDCVPDVVAECGPLGGIYSSLSLIKAEYGLDGSPMLIIPVDMPNLNTETLARVIVGASGKQCCHYENEVFPCVMASSEALYEYLSAMFENTESGRKGSMKGLMTFLCAHVIPMGELDQELFTNINYPADLDNIKD